MSGSMPPGKKKALIIGAVGGAALTVLISLMMDYMYADALQGTWRDAIAHDMKAYLSVEISPSGFVAYILFGVVLLVMGAIGALFGIIFMLIMYKFFSLLST